MSIATRHFAFSNGKFAFSGHINKSKLMKIKTEKVNGDTSLQFFETGVVTGVELASFVASAVNITVLANNLEDSII